MNAEVKCRKPMMPKFFCITGKFKTKFKTWQSMLPNNGDKIKITWLPDNNGVANAYIGMEGVVEDINYNTGDFVLNCETSKLICRGDFSYIKLT